MIEFLQQFRRNIESCWSTETCSPKFLPVDTENLAAGQCAPTSFVLLEELRNAFPDKRFAHVIGCVLKDAVRVIDYHLWVVEVTVSPKDTKVIDVTADQSKVLPQVVYESVDVLLANNITYVAYQISEESVFVHAEAKKRCEKLQERFRKYLQLNMQN